MVTLSFRKKTLSDSPNFSQMYPTSHRLTQSLIDSPNLSQNQPTSNKLNQSLIDSPTLSWTHLTSHRLTQSLSESPYLLETHPTCHLTPHTLSWPTWPFLSTLEVLMLFKLRNQSMLTDEGKVALLELLSQLKTVMAPYRSNLLTWRCT